MASENIRTRHCHKGGPCHTHYWPRGLEPSATLSDLSFPICEVGHLLPVALLPEKREDGVGRASLTRDCFFRLLNCFQGKTSIWGEKSCWGEVKSFSLMDGDKTHSLKKQRLIKVQRFRQFSPGCLDFQAPWVWFLSTHSPAQGPLELGRGNRTLSHWFT